MQLQAAVKEKERTEAEMSKQLKEQESTLVLLQSKLEGRRKDLKAMRARAQEKSMQEDEHARVRGAVS